MRDLVLNLRSARRILRDLRQRLEPRFAQVLASPNVREVFLDFDNGFVSVIVDQYPTPRDRRLMRDAVACAGHALMPTVAAWRTNIRTPFSYPFTGHGFHIRQQFEAEPLRPLFVVFDVLDDEVSAAREALAHIRSLLPRFDRVIAFASGGQPLLNFIIGQCATPQDLVDAQNKFHLFAGLNWGANPHAQQNAFKAWVAQNIDHKVLILDTGTSGTTFRETVRLVEGTLTASPAVNAVGRIQMVALVDGHNDEQVPVDTIVATAGGAGVPLSATYLPVPRVFSEDCAALLGYDPLREQLREHPVEQPGLFRVIGRPGRLGRFVENEVAPRLPARAKWLHWLLALLLSRLTPTHVVASGSASQSLVSLLMQPERHRPRARWFSRKMTLAAAMMIISDMKTKELQRLDKLREWGLLDEDECHALRRVVGEQYDTVVKRYPTTFWDWREKEFVRRGGATSFWGDGDADERMQNAPMWP